MSLRPLRILRETAFLFAGFALLAPISRATNIAVQADQDTGLLWRPILFFSGNAAAIRAVALPDQTGNSGKFLTTNGTATSWATISGGGDALVSQPLSQFASTTSAQLAGVISNETGSGLLVFNNAPTFIAPVLGAATAASINGVVISGAGSPSLGVTGASTISGTNTGDQTSVTGNAGTATALQTARNINGVPFDGTANITVTAAAGSLSGATLNSGVTASSLTSVGTLVSGVWNATAIANAYLATAFSGKTYEGLTITTTTGTLAITNGKTATFSNTQTFAGTDGTTQTFPATSQTIAGLTATQTLSGKKISLSAALGSDDTYEGIDITGLNAGASIAQWEAVYLGGSSTWLLADANGSGTFPARGLAVAAYSNTNAAIVLVNGSVRNDAWNWTPGGTIYLSTTAGALTQTAPSSSGDKVQQVGFALSADIAYFDFASGEYLTVQ